MCSTMDVKKYLKRIGFNEEEEVNINLETLGKLQQCHIATVPFENLDIFLGKAIPHDLELAYHKVVEEGRGGWCYQLNGLFCWLLQQLGFDVDMTSGHVWNPKNQCWSKGFVHLEIIVNFGEDKYMADVAWGGLPRAPIKPLLIKEGEITETVNSAYRLMKEEDLWFFEFFDGDLSWQRFFAFSLQPQKFEDYREMSSMLQMPGSVLYNEMIISKKDLHDDTLFYQISYRKYGKFRVVGRMEKVTLECEEDLTMERLGEILREKFGMNVDLENMNNEQWKRVPDFTGFGLP